MPLLPVADIINEFNVGPVRIDRYAPPTQNQYGEWVEASPTTIYVNPCAIHNLSGRSMNEQPEADRNQETIEVYTKIRLFSAEDNRAPDVVHYQGRTYTVETTMNYGLQGGCYMSIATLEDRQERYQAP
jgi:hypothetical protein